MTRGLRMRRDWPAGGNQPAFTFYFINFYHFKGTLLLRHVISASPNWSFFVSDVRDLNRCTSTLGAVKLLPCKVYGLAEFVSQIQFEIHMAVDKREGQESSVTLFRSMRIYINESGVHSIALKSECTPLFLE